MASQELGLFAYREGEEERGRARGKGRVNEASSVLQVCGSVYVWHCVCDRGHNSVESLKKK